MELGGARRTDHRSALRPHFPQLFEAALIALAPGGDAAFQPVRLELQLCVELLGRTSLVSIDFLHPGIVAAKADFQSLERTAIQPQCLFGQPGQKGTVMRDGDERALVAAQPFLQPVDRAEIEMVGWFVEQQQIWLRRQRPAQRGAAFLAAARLVCAGRKIRAQLVCDRLDLVQCRSHRSRYGKVAQGLERREIGFLFQHHYIDAGLNNSFPFVRLDFIRDQTQQCRLAGAVAPDQGQLVARSNVQVEVLEQPTLSLVEREILI